MPDHERQRGRPVSRADVVAEARNWLGTPFIHQHAAKGVGCDCLGLLRGVAKVLGVFPNRPDELSRVEEFRGYGKHPDGRLLRACEMFLDRKPVTAIAPGDVVLLAMTGSTHREPHHSAIVGDYKSCSGHLSLIHSLGPGHPNKVVEHRLDNRFRSYIVAAFAIRGVEP